MNSKIDHIVIGADNLKSGTNILEKKLNHKFSPGGEHKIMGTHNNLLKLQSDVYLEVIANNPKCVPPSSSRWFSLDELSTKKKIKQTPRSLCWVIAVDNIENAVNNCGYYCGNIIELSREKMKWKITIPKDGKLINNGVLPFLIEWPKNTHPSKNLNNSSIKLNKISLFHPEVNNIKNILNNLIKSDLITINQGIPRIEFHLETLDDKIIIN